MECYKNEKTIEGVLINVPEVPSWTSPISADVGIGSLFADSWKIYKKHWGKFLFSGIVMAAIQMGMMIADFMIEHAGDNIRPAEIAVCLFLGVALSAISGVFPLGCLKIASLESNGKPVCFGDVFPLGRTLQKFPKFFCALLTVSAAAAVVYSLVLILACICWATAEVSPLVVFVGLLAYVVGSYVLLFLSVRLFLFAWFFLFETDCGVFASFAASWRITRGRFGRTVGFGVLATMISYLGILLTFGLAQILILPLCGLWLAVYYLKLCKTCALPVPAGTL